MFIPDFSDGTVVVVDLESREVTRTAELVAPGTEFELFDRDGIVFYNDPGSERAGVVRIDGSFAAVRKYDPERPGAGVVPADGTSADDPGTPDATEAGAGEGVDEGAVGGQDPGGDEPEPEADEPGGDGGPPPARPTPRSPIPRAATPPPSPSPTPARRAGPPRRAPRSPRTPAYPRSPAAPRPRPARHPALDRGLGRRRRGGRAADHAGPPRRPRRDRVRRDLGLR